MIDENRKCSVCHKVSHVKWPVTEKEFLSLFEGRKISPVIRSIARLMPQLSHDDMDKVQHELTQLMLLSDNLDPETRRELLSTFDTCPFCQHWLGHNNPPPGAATEAPPRRKKTPLPPR